MLLGRGGFGKRLTAEEIDELGWFRHLLGFSAHEVYDMHITQYEVYRRWLEKWTPQVVYGAHAAGGVDTRGAAARRDETKLSDLPGGQIVRAF